ncbi:DsrE family protein [Arthrobacter dokdonensis]|uniref:DsrE family protein n=1 Tax=Arthrobacter dokdonellae TaxID=2211210 RepID=UPI001013C5BA|nr:DsrE family protein [Arthrobacter dokdonellae]
MAENTEAPQGLLMHAFGKSGEEVAGVFRSALNAAAGLPGAAIEMVVQGPAVAGLTADGGLAAPVAAVLERGVAVLACENSMRAAAVGSGSLLPGVTPVPSAVVHLARRQWDRWAYVRL